MQSASLLGSELSAVQIGQIYSELRAFGRSKTPSEIKLNADQSAKLHAKLGTEERQNLRHIVNITRKISEKDFAALARGDLDAMAPVRLSNEEMSLLKAGGFWSSLGKIFAVVAGVVAEIGLVAAFIANPVLGFLVLGLEFGIVYGLNECMGT